MKKTVAILLLLIYGSTTMGATVYVHYCMDEFAGWSLFNGKDKKCGKCGKCGMQEENKEGCCKDEHKQFKLKVDHQKVEVAQLFTLFISPGLSVPIVDFTFHSLLNITERYPTGHAPPDIGQEKLYVHNCVFLV